MAELKALSQDVLKNASDIANYNREFQNLQVQLHQMSQTTFNGVSSMPRQMPGTKLILEVVFRKYC